MKKFLLLAPIAAMLVFASCEDNDNHDNDGDNHDTLTVQHTDTVVIRERETYRTNLQNDIDRMQAKLDSMDNRAESKTNVTWQRDRSRLQIRLDRAKADMKEFSNKADNEWDGFKSTVDARMDTLRMEWDSLDWDLDVKTKKK